VSTHSRRPFATLRWGGTLLAAAGLIALGLVDSGQATAHAASGGYDQMNGTGSTSSAVTVPWTQGLLGSNNQPVTTDDGELNPN
jgi:hypothetical protein